MNIFDLRLIYFPNSDPHASMFLKGLVLKVSEINP